MSTIGRRLAGVGLGALFGVGAGGSISPTPAPSGSADPGDPLTEQNRWACRGGFDA